MSVQRLKSKLEKRSINSYWCKVNYYAPGKGKVTCSLAEPPDYEERSDLEYSLISVAATDVIYDWGETVGLDFSNSVCTGVATLEYQDGVVRVKYDSGWQEV